MKKTLLIIGLLLGSISMIKGQEISNNTIGLRLESASLNSIGISYQKKIGTTSRLQFDVNSDFTDAAFAGSYQKVWALNDDFNWFAGVGASYSNQVNNFSAFGGLGVEYNFEGPWLASIEANPINISQNGDFDFGSNFSLALRYQF